MEEPDAPLSDARLYLCLPSAMQCAPAGELLHAMNTFGAVCAAYRERLGNTVDVAAPAMIVSSACRYARVLLAAYKKSIEAIGKTADVVLADGLLEGLAVVLDGEGVKVIAADPGAAQQVTAFLAEWFALIAPADPGSSPTQLTSTPGTDAVLEKGVTAAVAACVKTIAGQWAPGANGDDDEARCGALYSVSSWLSTVGADAVWASGVLHHNLLSHLVLAGEKLGTLAAAGAAAEGGNALTTRALSHAALVEEAVFEAVLCVVAANDEAEQCLDDEGVDTLLRVTIAHWNTRTSTVLHSCCGALRYQAWFFLNVQAAHAAPAVAAAATLGKLLLSAFSLSRKLGGAEKGLVTGTAVPPLLDPSCKVWLAYPLALLLRRLSWEGEAEDERQATPMTPGTIGSSTAAGVPSVTLPAAVMDTVVDLAGLFDFPDRAASRPVSAKSNKSNRTQSAAAPPELEPARAWAAAVETLWSAKAWDAHSPVADHVAALGTALGCRSVFLPPPRPATDVIVPRLRALTDRAALHQQPRALRTSLSAWRALVRCGVPFDDDAPAVGAAGRPASADVLTRALRLNFGDARVAQAVFEVLARTACGGYTPVTPSTGTALDACLIPPGPDPSTRTGTPVSPPTTAGGGVGAHPAPFPLATLKEACLLAGAFLDPSTSLRPHSAGTIDSLDIESMASSRPGTAAVEEGTDAVGVAWAARLLRGLLSHPSLNSERKGKHPDQNAMRKAVVPCLGAVLVAWMTLQRRTAALSRDGASRKACPPDVHAALGEVCEALTTAVRMTSGRWGAGVFGLSGPGVDRLCRILTGAPAAELTQAPKLLQHYLSVTAAVLPHLDKQRRKAGEDVPAINPSRDDDADSATRPPSRPESRAAGTPAALARADIDLIERVLDLRVEVKRFPYCPIHLLSHVHDVTFGASARIGAMYAGSQKTFGAMIKSLGDDPTSHTSTHDAVDYATRASKFLAEFTEAHPNERPVFAKQCIQGLADRVRSLVDGVSRRAAVFQEFRELVPVLEMILRAEAKTLTPSLDEFCSEALADAIAVVMFSSLLKSPQAKLDLLASLCHSIGTLRPSEYAKEKIERALASSDGTDPFFSGSLFLPFTMWLEKGGQEGKEWVRARTETFWPSLTAYGNTLAWWWGETQQSAPAAAVPAGEEADGAEGGPAAPAPASPPSPTADGRVDHTDVNGKYLVAPLEFFTVLFRQKCVAKARVERVVDSVVSVPAEDARPTSPGPAGARNEMFFIEYYILMLGRGTLPQTGSAEAAVVGWFLAVLARHVRDRQRRRSYVAELTTPMASQHSGTRTDFSGTDDAEDPLAAAVNDRILAVNGMGFVGVALQTYLERASAMQDADPATATASRARKADCLRGYKALQVHNEVASSLDDRSLEDLKIDLRAAVRAKTQSQSKIDDLTVRVEELQDQVLEEGRAAARAVNAVKTHIRDLEMKRDLEMVDQDNAWRARLEENEAGWRAKLGGHADIPELLEKMQTMEFNLGMAERTATQLGIQQAAELKKLHSRHATQLYQAEARFKEKEESILKLHAVETEHYKAEREALLVKSAKLDQLQQEEALRSQYVGVEERAKTSALSTRVQQLVAENAGLFQTLHETQEAHARKVKTLQADFEVELQQAVARERSHAAAEEAVLQAEVHDITEESSFKTATFALLRQELDARKQLKAGRKAEMWALCDTKDRLVAEYLQARCQELQNQLLTAERLKGEHNTSKAAANDRKARNALYRKHREIKETLLMEAADAAGDGIQYEDAKFAATGIPALVAADEPAARQGVFDAQKDDYRRIKRSFRDAVLQKAAETTDSIHKISQQRIDEFNAKWETYVADVEETAATKVKEMEEVNVGYQRDITMRDAKIAQMKAQHTQMSTELAKALNKTREERRASITQTRDLRGRMKKAEKEIEANKERRRTLPNLLAGFTLERADTDAGRQTQVVDPDTASLPPPEVPSSPSRASNASDAGDEELPPRYEVGALLCVLQAAEAAVRAEISGQRDAALRVADAWRETVLSHGRPRSADCAVTCELLMETVRPESRSRQVSACNLLDASPTAASASSAASPSSPQRVEESAKAFVCDLLYGQLLQLPEEEWKDAAAPDMAGLRALEAAVCVGSPAASSTAASSESAEPTEITEVDYVRLTYDALLALPPANFQDSGEEEPIKDGESEDEPATAVAAVPASAEAAAVYRALFRLLLEEAAGDGDRGGAPPTRSPLRAYMTAETAADVAPQDDVPAPSSVTVDTAESVRDHRVAESPKAQSVVRTDLGVAGRGRQGLAGRVSRVSFAASRAESVSGEPYPPRPRRVTVKGEDALLRDEVGLLRHALSKLYHDGVAAAVAPGADVVVGAGARCFTPGVLRRMSVLLNRRVAAQQQQQQQAMGKRGAKSDAGTTNFGWSRNVSIWSDCPGLQVLSMASRSHRPSVATTLRSMSYISTHNAAEEEEETEEPPTESPTASSPCYAKAHAAVIEQLVADHDTELQALKQDLAAARTELDEWKAAYRQYENRIATNRELKELTETHRQAVTERNFLTSEVRTLRERLAKANSAELNLIARCDQLQHEGQQLRDLLKSTTATSEARQEAIITLAKEIEDLKFEGAKAQSAFTPPSSTRAASIPPAHVQTLTKENEEQSSQIAVLQYQLAEAHAKARRLQITSEKLASTEAALRQEGMDGAIVAWKEAKEENARLEEALLTERRQRERCQREKEEAVKEVELAMQRRVHSSEKYHRVLQTRDSLHQREKDLQALNHQLAARTYDLDTLDRHLSSREQAIRAASVQARRLAPIQHPTTVPEDSAAWLAPVRHPVHAKPPHHPHKLKDDIILNNTI
eukprot:TRINITY_DN14036_c2_g1_i1.p1 TRINITY_DN14036_c2_g1~~TRINITY_DN14036_c2_g1_i1.p1  ORF type:complete len:3201 (+),score=1192.31 TRINITY_DN14036_c2_g1_i1:1104-9605(+)